MVNKSTIDNKIKDNSRKYQELLDSDDEFPIDYYEIPSTPAYKIDSRFDKITFKWINDPEKYNYSNKNLPSKTNPLTEKQDNVQQDPTTGNIINDRLVIQKGILSKKDLYCLKLIQGCIGDSTFTWLIQFLIYKDIQSIYSIPKSCLVSTGLCYEKNAYKNMSLCETKSLYKLVIKV
ncbi:unnamed protein product, partial [Brenthis ino]